MRGPSPEHGAGLSPTGPWRGVGTGRPWGTKRGVPPPGRGGLRTGCRQEERKRLLLPKPPLTFSKGNGFTSRSPETRSRRAPLVSAGSLRLAAGCTSSHGPPPRGGQAGLPLPGLSCCHSSYQRPSCPVMGTGHCPLSASSCKVGSFRHVAKTRGLAGTGLTHSETSNESLHFPRCPRILCPVPSPGGCSGLRPPVVSGRLCSQPLPSARENGSFPPAPRGPPGCAPAASSSMDACPHVTSSAGRRGPEIREPRATGGQD